MVLSLSPAFRLTDGVDVAAGLALMAIGPCNFSKQVSTMDHSQAGLHFLDHAWRLQPHERSGGQKFG